MRIGSFYSLSLFSGFISNGIRNGTIVASNSRQYSSVMIPSLPRLLSIQSHVIHGFVGSKAACFPLQCMGFDVNCINTITLSNHPGYSGGTGGKSISNDDYQELIDGLEKNNLLLYDVIINGYTKTEDNLTLVYDTIKKVMQVNEKCIYVCDPVLGDDGKLYVPMSLIEVYRSKLIPLSYCVIPNQFEAEVLTGCSITSIKEAKVAIQRLHDMGPKVVILKGLRLDDDPSSLSIMASIVVDGDDGSSASRQSSIIRCKINKIDQKYVGCGDCFVAITTGLIHQCVDRKKHISDIDLCEIVENACKAMETVLIRSQLSSSKELRIIDSIDTFIGLKDSTRSISDTNSKTNSLIIANNHKISGIIFDMDGTLTNPGAIDFNKMYLRVGELIRLENEKLLSMASASAGVNEVVLHQEIDRKCGDILSQVNAITNEVLRQKAHDIIIDEELVGVANMSLRHDLVSFLSLLKKNRIQVAISTRNCQYALEKFLEHELIQQSGVIFHPILSRDSLNSINKPDPFVATHIHTHTWDTSPVDDQHEIWFVGDSIDDILCGKGSGCKTCLIETKENLKVDRQLPNLVVGSLMEFAHSIGLR